MRAHAHVCDISVEVPMSSIGENDGVAVRTEAKSLAALLLSNEICNITVSVTDECVRDDIPAAIVRVDSAIAPKRV